MTKKKTRAIALRNDNATALDAVRAAKTSEPELRFNSLRERWLSGLAEHTRKTYEEDLEDFARFFNAPTVDDALFAFLGAGPDDAFDVVEAYKLHMELEPPKGRGLAPATINRRISALRSIVKRARVGWKLDVALIKVDDGIRDTRGPGLDVIRTVIDSVEKQAKEDPRAVRDVAMLKVLIGVGLRRAEVGRLDMADVAMEEQAIRILPKAKGAERHRRKILRRVGPAAWAAILRWIKHRGTRSGPLFHSFSNRAKGCRLSKGALNWIIRERVIEAGFVNPKCTLRPQGKWCNCCGKLPDGRSVTPHGFRHTAITTAIRESHGNLAMAQDFSRHANADMLRVYDDARGERVMEAQTFIEMALFGEGEKGKRNGSETPDDARPRKVRDATRRHLRRAR